MYFWGADIWPVSSPCVYSVTPKVAAVFPNQLGRLSSDVSGCATPQNPSRIDSLSFIDFGRHSVFCICAYPENTRKLLQSFQIDLYDSQLMCLVAQLHKNRARLILCPSLTLDDTQYFVFVRTPRIPESCCSLSKSTWMTLDCCVWLRNSTIPEPD